MSTHENPRLLDEVRQVLRVRHYSIHTEHTYCDWIRRYVRYHAMTCREDLDGGEAKIEAFLTHLAIDENVAPANQNQAMNAIVFLYKQVLKQPLDQTINAVRAARKPTVPVVLSRDEVAQIIALMQGTPQLVVKLLYGSGLRISEATRLRVQDIDRDLKQLTVRDGKGGKDRFTTLPASVIPLLDNHPAGSSGFTRRRWRTGTVRCTCLTLWRANAPLRNERGGGSMFSRPGTALPTPAAA